MNCLIVLMLVSSAFLVEGRPSIDVPLPDVNIGDTVESIAKLPLGDWKDFLEEEEVTLAPDECTVYNFKTDKSQYRITVDVSDFNGCDPSDIQLSPVAYYEGQCFKTAKLGLQTVKAGGLECAVPGPYGVESEKHVCDNFDELKTEKFTPDEADGDSMDVTGAICFEESTYYFAMKSSCSQASKVKISVDKKPLPISLQDARCLTLQSFHKEAASLWHKLTHEYLWVLILLIVVVVIVLPAAITMCICFCACCQCCKCCISIAKTPCKCAACGLKPIKKVFCCCC